VEAATSTAPTTALEVRERLVEALELDLVGPWPGHELERELLPGWVRPSNWYLTGFLIPVDAPGEQAADPDAAEELEAVPESEGLPEESAEERASAKPGLFPSSIGLSTLVAAAASELSVTIRWGDYEHEPGEERADEDGGAERRPPVWRRIPREQTLTVALGQELGAARAIAVPESHGVELHVLERKVSGATLDGDIPTGARSVSLFLVNNRRARTNQPDEAYVFQPELEVRGREPFLPRPDLRGARADEWDERVSDLHYRDTPEYATGHGIAADWQLEDGGCRTLRTRWIPRAAVEKTEPALIDGVVLDLDALGELADGAAAQSALSPLVAAYRGWIAARGTELDALTSRRRDTAGELLRRAALAADRIERGIALLAADGDALDAFRMANRAVARALRRRLRIREPAWRPFQLAFILLNLPSVAAGDDVHRDTVDLLYFPTGGGKTEAYLGLAAFTIVLRRLRHPGDEGRAGAGVSVVMRYTLRLLTLDQLARAAGLVCALELERETRPERYGTWPFEIGLWVGKAATPNDIGRRGDDRQDTARAKVRQFKADPRGRPSPIPLEECPWCGQRFTPDSFSLVPDADHPRELQIVCTSLDCDFSAERALPIVAVDQPIYRRLPAFLIATVDKFATLPWVGESGALLGGADRYDETGFYGAAEPRQGRPLSAPLRPPDLVIQDELHLISGPLGTMAGLYETAIDGLCTRGEGSVPVRPKVVASTATARRADDQVQALFARCPTEIFPPPGPDRRDSFFARTVPASEAPARLYVGVAAQGRNPKVVMRKVWLPLMAAAEQAYRDAGGHKSAANPADPYMTIVGYFNSLRELGGARRILEEEVRSTLAAYGRERRRIGERGSRFQDRRTFSEVVELTSRVPTDKVAEARRRLGQTFDQRDRIDCAIATNMISVGLDIQRLGLMGVIGQPKTASEYIQATSRVGRAEEAPGLVVTLLNVNKPRDRSHYERFRHFHETFYRSVEVSSVTPFAARALDRGFAGALVALARHLVARLTPPRGVEGLVDVRPELERRLRECFAARVAQQPFDDEAERDERLADVQSRIVDLLDSWLKVVRDYRDVGIPVQYQLHEQTGPRPLLHEMLDSDFDSEHQRKFRVGRSLRDVEPSVNLFLKELTGDAVSEGG
jgi:hypothetical protein